jgi:hypothetical protein
LKKLKIKLKMIDEENINNLSYENLINLSHEDLIEIVQIFRNGDWGINTKQKLKNVIIIRNRILKIEKIKNEIQKG